MLAQLCQMALQSVPANPLTPSLPAATSIAAMLGVLNLRWLYLDWRSLAKLQVNSMQSTTLSPCMLASSAHSSG